MYLRVPDFSFQRHLQKYACMACALMCPWQEAFENTTRFHACVCVWAYHWDWVLLYVCTKHLFY